VDEHYGVVADGHRAMFSLFRNQGLVSGVQ